MEWISVKDRMPENDDVVLVYLPYEDEIWTADFEKERIEEFKDKFFFANDGWEMITDGGRKESPSHWMPLPKPPKEE